LHDPRRDRGRGDDDSFLLRCGITAAVTRGRELISGLAACDGDLIFMFNMIRR
jgi:hypothetical protein